MLETNSEYKIPLIAAVLPAAKLLAAVVRTVWVFDRQVNMILYDFVSERARKIMKHNKSLLISRQESIVALLRFSRLSMGFLQTPRLDVFTPCPKRQIEAYHSIPVIHWFCRLSTAFLVPCLCSMQNTQSLMLHVPKIIPRAKLRRSARKFGQSRTHCWAWTGSLREPAAPAEGRG